MNTTRSLVGITWRVAALSFVLAGTTSLMQAQQSATPGSSTSYAPFFRASDLATPFDLTGSLVGTSSSSSSSDATPSYAKLDFDAPALGNSQPPPRRSYGRPSYSGGNSNPDGSQKWFGLGGAGIAIPVGNTHKYETPNWGIQVGVGRNFNKFVGLDAEFNYDHFGLQGATIANATYIYNYCTIDEYDLDLCAPEGAAASGSATPVDGNNHVWSFTLNPRYTLATEGPLGAYLVVGGGYYHKVTDFTTPTEECDYYYGCGYYNATFDHYTSNAPGVNGGFGLTYKFSKFSGEAFYLEAKYVLIFNSQRYGVTSSNVATSPLNASDYYPANSNRTSYVPIKFGIRF